MTNHTRDLPAPDTAPATSDHSTNRRVRLVPVSLVPATALYEVAYLTGAADRWRTRGRTVSIETFASMLQNNGDASFAVVDTDRDGTVVGYVGLYNVDEVSLVGSISAFFDPRMPDAGFVAGAAIHLFAQHVFGVIGLRKLMIESPASGSAYLDRAARFTGVATKEGTLREHSRLGPVYEDVELFAVWGDAYLARYGTARPGTYDGTDTFTAVVRAIEDVMETHIADPAGGLALQADLQIDSLALIEILDRLEGGDALDLESLGEGHSLTVQSIVEAIERPRRP